MSRSVNRPVVALFGGTFNPPHKGHLRMAKRVVEEISADKVLFIPAFISPHKAAASAIMINPATRLEMTELLVDNMETYAVSPVEIARGGKSFTIDTIRELKEGALADSDLYLILGEDSFRDIRSWKDHKEIFKEVSIVVLARQNAQKLTNKSLDKILNIELSLDFCYDFKDGTFISENSRKVLLIEDFREDISSTAIRAMISQKCDDSRLGEFLTKPVLEFIKAGSLYK